MRIRKGDASVLVTRREGCLFAHDLECYGDTVGLLQIIRELQAIARSEPLYLHVSLSNPKAERLMRLYQKLGATVEAVILKGDL